METTHTRLKALLRVFYEKRQPVMLQGPTGIGKSVGVIEFCKDELAKEVLKRKFVEWNSISESEKLSYWENEKKRGETLLFVDERINLKDNTDNKGIPQLTGKYLKWIKTLIINIASMENSSVVFFKDEFNHAPPSVMNSEFQWILNNAIDDISFADGVYTIAAGNRLEDKAQVSEMSSPLKNRFAHLTLLPPSVEEWTDWALKNGVDSRIIGFLHFKESNLFTFKPDLKEDAFATPRAWMSLSNLISGLTDMTLIKEISQAMIGDGTGHEFFKFVELEMKIKLDDYLKNPKKLEEIPSNKMDVKHAILSSAIERYRKKPEVLKLAAVFVKHLPPQFAIYFLKMLRMTDEKYFKSNILKTSVWDYIRDNYGKYIV